MFQNIFFHLLFSEWIRKDEYSSSGLLQMKRLSMRWYNLIQIIYSLLGFSFQDNLSDKLSDCAKFYVEEFVKVRDQFHPQSFKISKMNSVNCLCVKTMHTFVKTSSSVKFDKYDWLIAWLYDHPLCYYHTMPYHTIPLPITWSYDHSRHRAK